ncbi:hypothetical protein CYMTET_42606 [Cymbomonas tetramitiformis]|uniref:Ion channel CASTOR n=1 Tax=Cymbomonas tetramitiformis TaxID=36881 RepID=A0AAE0C5I1_9CHLO|nr:hypothetical protein CYMTET_42606 [Cymbomonas tetramitiformis]
MVQPRRTRPSTYFRRALLVTTAGDHRPLHRGRRIAPGRSNHEEEDTTAQTPDRLNLSLEEERNSRSFRVRELPLLASENATYPPEWGAAMVHGLRKGLLAGGLLIAGVLFSFPKAAFAKAGAPHQAASIAPALYNPNARKGFEDRRDDSLNRILAFNKEGASRWVMLKDQAPALLIVVSTTVLVVLGGSYAVRKIHEFNGDKMPFMESIWFTWGMIVASSNHTKMKGWPIRGVSLGLFFLGIVTYSIMIGTITSRIKTQIDMAAKGISTTKVTSVGHLVIAGYNSQVPPMLNHLQGLETGISALCSRRTVLLSEPDRFSSDKAQSYAQGVGDKILHRQGNMFNPKTLDLANFERASGFVIMGSGSDRNDASAKSVINVLALSKIIEDFPGHVVVQVPNNDTAELVKSVGGLKIEPVVDMSASLFLHCGRFPGLSHVYRTLLSHDAATRLLLVTLPADRSVLFKEVQARLADAGSTACGILQQPVNPSTKAEIIWSTELTSDDVVNPDDLVVAIGAPKVDVWSPTWSPPEYIRELRLTSKTSKPQTRRKAPMPPSNPIATQEEGSVKAVQETLLVLGWNSGVARMIMELDETYDEFNGSARVLVLSHTPIAERENYLKKQLQLEHLELKHLDVKHVTGSPISTTALKSLIDHYVRDSSSSSVPQVSVIVVSEANWRHGGEQNKADQDAIYTLLMAEKLCHTQGVPIANMIAEVVDPKLADDIGELHPSVSCIAMNEIMSLMTAGVVEHRDINAIWKELMAAEGYEIYLKPSFVYLQPPITSGILREQRSEELTFGSLVKRAEARGDIAIGYRTADGTLVINPDHTDTLKLSNHDAGHNSIVVISQTNFITLEAWENHSGRQMM